MAILASNASISPVISQPPLDDGLSHPGLELIVTNLREYEYILSIFTGFSDGRFFQVIATRNQPEIIQQYKTPGKTGFIVRSISLSENGTLRQFWRYLDDNLELIGKKDETITDYDPRQRPWYVEAMKAAEKTVFTEPYMFKFAQVPGITCADKFSDSSGVFGVDITLKGLHSL